MDLSPFCINAWSKHSLLIILHKVEFLIQRWIIRCWNLAGSNNLILLYFTDSKNRRALKSNKWTRVGVPISISYHSTVTLLWDVLDRINGKADSLYLQGSCMSFFISTIDRLLSAVTRRSFCYDVSVFTLATLEELKFQIFHGDPDLRTTFFGIRQSCQLELSIFMCFHAAFKQHDLWLSLL